MGGLEWNKIFAAILVAGILGLGSSIVADMAVEPTELKQNAYAIEVSEGSVAAQSQTEAEKIDPVSPLLAKADVAHGESLTKVCTSCHSFEKGGPNKVGPNLWGVVGGPHDHMQGYSYSDALEKTASEKWDYEALNQFLHKPTQYVPGTKMGFAGYKKVQDRADVIAWLRTQSDSPVPLP